MRASRVAPAGTRALVLADPDVRGKSPDGELDLEKLPGARREAHAISRILDLDPHQVAEGAAASERLVKKAPLGSMGILHLAAHARADAAFPDRSAVFLSAGHAGEDGLLQPNEIAALDLRGRLVVLSACDSAEGALLPGEGPLSLARAFFAAGARAVVATRWPLRDDDAAFMIERFYKGLAEGRTVAAALQVARRDAIEARLPAAAWAGLAVLGDGGQQPVVAQPSHHSVPRWLAAGIPPVVIAFVISMHRRRRRHGPIAA
jgi:CHAT domain-containing protein